MIHTIHGKIQAVNGGAVVDGQQRYRSDNTNYTIIATLPDSDTIVLENQVPQIRLWGGLPDLFINAAYLVGVSVIGTYNEDDEELRWHFYEPPLVQVCQTAPPPSQSPLMVEEERLRIIRSGFSPTQFEGGGLDGSPPNQGGSPP